MCAGGEYMYQISNEKFGLFVTELRKEKDAHIVIALLTGWGMM